MEDLLYIILGFIVLWAFPAMMLLKINRKALLYHALIQVGYSLFFLWLMEYRGQYGSSFLWAFYWTLAFIIHMVGLNISVFVQQWKNKKSIE